MKQSLTPILFLCATIFGRAYSEERTSVIASRMRYPQTIITLRNETDSFLRDLRIRMTLDVQELLATNHGLRAEEKTTLSKDAYFNLERKIDQAFEELSREYISGAKKLDATDASVNDKQDFIRHIRKKAQEKIDKLLGKKAKLALNNPLNVDI